MCRIRSTAATAEREGGREGEREREGEGEREGERERERERGGVSSYGGSSQNLTGITENAWGRLSRVFALLVAHGAVSGAPHCLERGAPVDGSAESDYGKVGCPAMARSNRSERSYSMKVVKGNSLSSLRGRDGDDAFEVVPANEGNKRYYLRTREIKSVNICDRENKTVNLSAVRTRTADEKK